MIGLLFSGLLISFYICDTFSNTELLLAMSLDRLRSKNRVVTLSLVTGIMEVYQAVQCTVYSVHCTLYSVHCTVVFVYSVHFTVYCVHCTALQCLQDIPQ